MTTEGKNNRTKASGAWEGPLMKPGMRSKRFKVEQPPPLRRQNQQVLALCAHTLSFSCARPVLTGHSLGFRQFSHQLVINWSTEQSPSSQLSQVPPWKTSLSVKSSQDGVMPTCSSDFCAVNNRNEVRLIRLMSWDFQELTVKVPRLTSVCHARDNRTRRMMGNEAEWEK